MKKLVLYLMLLMAVPATAQSGLYGSHSHHSHAPAERPHHGSLMHHEHHGPQVHAMDADDFEAVLGILARETFDFRRLETAKEVARGNWMSARQIARICELFTYDSNRLDFAKRAYASCVNKGMYVLVEETFTYNSSKDELHEFIRNWRR